MLDDHEVRVAFGKFIREGREKQHLYQSHLAASLDMSQQYYSHIENGSRSVDFVLALKICKLLSLNINDFISTYTKITP